MKGSKAQAVKCFHLLNWKYEIVYSSVYFVPERFITVQYCNSVVVKASALQSVHPRLLDHVERL